MISYLKKFILLFISYVLVFSSSYGQVTISNGGFEGVASAGSYKLNLKNWFDCEYFSETPPDLQPGFFGVTVIPSEGNTYLGMVVRDNNTWESIAQFLKSPIIKDVCHEFTIDLCRSEIYKSASRFAGIKDYTEPIILRIWRGNNKCEKEELLVESPIIENTEWQTYSFEIKSKSDC